MKINVLICGIGGQGVVLLGNFLRQYMLNIHNSAYIIGTESRGVSQREGSVISTVRIDTEGNSYFGPEIPQHEADIIIGMEPIEVLRNLDYAHNKTILLVNRNAIIPKNIILDELNKKGHENLFKNNGLKMNFHDSSNIIEVITELYRKLPPNNYTREISFKEISPQDLDENFSDKIVIKRLSTIPEIVDLDLTNLMIKHFDSTSLMNFVFLGILSSLVPYFEYEHITGFITQFFKATDKRGDFLSRNLKALNFGKELAYKLKKK